MPANPFSSPGARRGPRAASRLGALAAVVVALWACAASVPGGGKPEAGPIAADRPPLRIDHHVHILGPGLIRDWKSLGVSFSRPDDAYLSPARLLGQPGAADPSTAAIDRALLVPMAHLYAEEEFRTAMGLSIEEEQRRVAAENDHVAREAARYPGRALAFCSAGALRPYALDELTRCRRVHGSAGVKLHLASSGVDLRDDAHLARVAAIAAWAERERLPILLHLDTQRRGTTVDHVRQFARRVLEPHPQLTVIVAHLGGSGGYGPWTRSVFATLRDWLAERERTGLPATALYFELSAVLLEKESEGVPATTAEQAAALAEDLRAFGLERILFGSDAPVFDPARTAGLLAELAGLTPSEIAAIRANSVPGLFRD